MLKPKYFWTLFVFIFIAKLVIGASMPMFADEAYYWFWSQNLQLSYYDHPAFIAWLFKIGGVFDFLPGQFTRWPGIILSQLTLIPWILLADKIFNIKHKSLWLLVMALNPLFGIGSLVQTPDIPLMFFWSWSFYFLIKILNEPRNLIWGALLGASVGLGICSKYHAFLFLPLATLSLIIHSVATKRLTIAATDFLKQTLVTLALAFLFSFPVFYWNLQHDFISFKFQLDHGLGAPKWKPEWTIVYIIGQILLIYPVYLLAFRSTPKNKEQWFTLVFAAFPLLFFFLTSFKGRVEGNWPIIAYPFVYTLFFSYDWPLKAAYRSIKLWSVILTLVLVHIFIQPLPGLNQTKLHELEFYAKLNDEIQGKRPFFATTYQMASKLSYENNESIHKLYGMNRKDFFDYLEKSKPDKFPYYIVLRDDEFLPKWAIDAGHVVVEKTKIFDRYFVCKVDQ